mmetsp:Transcript_25146/g.54894  ORF Transcript_25146/g.54894 Transcript_25146/m.54894 type:complete len:198 (-) Transcript_25146:30-623(-)
MKSHYETLGIAKDATKDDIKKAFRKLSMETHPDVAKGAVNTERFKQISEAHAVLSNDKKRRMYDADMQDWFGRRRKNSPGPPGGERAGFAYGPHGNTGRPSSSYTFFHHMLDGIYKPRNLVVGVTLGFASVAFVKSLFSDEKNDRLKKKTGRANLVEAWKNPATGCWETPAPWDITYQRLKPTLQLVPREKVRESKR